MIAISTAKMPANSVGSNGDSKASYADVSNTIIDCGEQKKSSTDTYNNEVSARSNYEIYSQLVHDQLNLAVTSKNSGPFLALLSDILASGKSSSGEQPDHEVQNLPMLADENAFKDIGLYAILRLLAHRLDSLEQTFSTPIVLKLISIEKWCEISTRVTEAFLNFFSVLVSSSPRWWPEVTKKMVAQFVDARLDLTPQHTMIRKVLQIVPTSSAAFGDILSKNFPHKSSSSDQIANYVSNLLQVVEYAPEQMTTVWEIVIQRLIELDVECEKPDKLRKSRHLEHLYSSSEYSDSDADSDLSVSSDEDSDMDDLESSVSTGDNKDDSSTDVSDAEDDLPSTPVQSAKRSIDSMDSDDTPVDHKRLKLDFIQEGDEVTGVELDMASQLNTESMSTKVDAVLSLLLDHLSLKFSSKAVQLGEATPLFKVLLQVFKKLVLCTSHLHAVQFIWFHITHVHPDLLASYLSVLLEIAMSNSISFDQRSRAIQYVASFVARAKGLSKPQIVFVVGFLSDWVCRFIKEREAEVDSATSMARFRVFYAAVQALFYIFVFRHDMLRTLCDDDDEDDDENTSAKHGQSQWEIGLDKVLQQVINTKFNPLQYCQPEVVAMFARIAQDEQVASCYSIIERNRWGRFRGGNFESAVGNLTNASNGLFANNRGSKLYDSFFPFQPLRLRKSKKYFTEIYERWEEHDPIDSDTDREHEQVSTDDESDDEEDEEEE